MFAVACLPPLRSLPLAALLHLRTLGVAQTRLSPAGVAAVKRLAARGVAIVR